MPKRAARGDAGVGPKPRRSKRNNTAPPAAHNYPTLANCAGRDDLRTEFLGYSLAAEAVGILLDPEVDCLKFESVHDPDRDGEMKDLIYIKIGKPMAMNTFAKIMRRHLSRYFSYFYAFDGSADQNYKQQMDFLARSKASGDPAILAL